MTAENSADFSLKLSPVILENIENLQNMLGSPTDLVIRQFKAGKSGHAFAIACIDGLFDKDLINGHVLKTIQLGIQEAGIELPQNGEEILERLEFEVLTAHDLKRVRTWDDVSLAILSGDTALFVEGTDQVLTIGSEGWASRGVEEPITESVVRGPREGFTENIRTNTALIRRRIKDPNLRLNSYKIGRRSKRELVVAYVEGILHPDIHKELDRRLKAIDSDDAPESGYIEQMIQDSFLSPFPTVMHTERPDKTASSILQGKAAVLLDGTPFVLIVPVTFGQMLHSPEDYYENWLIGSFIRVLRYMASFVAVFLPSLYIALVSFHQGMIPSKLAFAVAASREGVPFPAFVEAIIMEITLELLREAGLRLPKPIGQTIGIVGGLVIGESAVAAGIVSPIMVIVVAVTAIASFAIPAYNLGISFRILRFGIMVAAAAFGLFGIVMAYIMINIHMTHLKSFGLPYTAPFSPTFTKDFRDLVVRFPLPALTRRPQMLQTEDKVRMREKENP